VGGRALTAAPPPRSSAGQTLDWDGATHTVEELTEASFAGVDIALFSAGGSISKKFGPLASAAGATVVDNSSAFRMDPAVPLVIPEVNPGAMAGMRAGKGGIVANPNCSTIIALMAVTPIHRAVGVKRMVVSTYQAASGAGQVGRGGGGGSGGGRGARRRRRRRRRRPARPRPALSGRHGRAGAADAGGAGRQAGDDEHLPVPGQGRGRGRGGGGGVQNAPPPPPPHPPPPEPINH